MLEQGELPLMRELTSLKKNRGLQHPSTISSWKSPRMGVSNAGSNSSNSTLQKVEGNEWEEDCKDYHTIAGGQGEKTKRGSFRSPQFSKGDARLSWDMNKEAFLELDPRHEARGKLRQLENIKKNLEKVRVSGETRVWGNVNVEAGADESSTAESLEEEEDEEEANSSWIIQPNTVGARRCPSQREYARLIKASHRISKKDSVVKQSASTLSPLVLNPQDDLHKLGHHKSLFSLEETYYEELPLEHRALMTGPREVSAMKSESRSHSPFLSQISSKKQATLAKISPTHAFTPAAQACRGSPAPLEAELFEIDPLELPGSKCRKSYTKSTGQGRPLSLDTRRALRRKPDTIYQRTSRSRKVSNSLAYSTMSSMLPKVSLAGPPPLTVPEDDNKSDESIGPLVDGHHHGKLSRGEIPGSLDLEALTASGGHRKGPLVEIADAERLQLAVRESKELVLCEDKPRSLSQKYRPRVFGEIIGQHIVTQSLSNAISKEKIAPVYLFQGPRGTGKTSSARILAAALLCIASQKQRPCGLCKECDLVSSGKNSDVKEVDAASHNGIVKVKALLEEIVLASALSHYKIFIIDECHVLTTETWNALLKVLEEPPMNVVFILITTDPDRLPRTAVSRCQKFPFPKIKDSDIMKRLIKLAGLEHLELDSEVLQLIASRSDGSLRDAEMILDQLSLLGQEVDSSTVYELVGSASDERMLSLLDSALVADTVKTIQRARELVDSGVQPLSLMSQMASLIIDILSGSYKFKDEQRKGFFHRQTLSEDKLERLRKAMKTLSEAEKQLRVSNDKMTWLTAALLQLGPDRSCMFPMSGAGTSVTQSPIIFDDAENDTIDINYISPLQRQYWLNDANPNQKQTPEDFSTSKSELVMLSADEQEKIVSVDRPMMFSDVQEELFRNKDHEQANKASLMVSLNDLRKEHLLIPGRLDDIWFRVVQSCRPFRLRQSLHGHGKLVSISLSEVDAVVHLEFCHPEHKTRCERSQKTIVNMFEVVLGFPVQVEIGLVSVLGADQPGCTTCTLADCSGKEGFVREGNEILGYEKTMLSVGVSGSTLQSDGTECFPATPQAPSDSASKDLQCLRTGSPDWNRNNLSCMNKGDLRMEGSNCVKANILSCISTETKPLDVKLSSEEQLDSAWINDAERFSPSLSAYGTDAAKMQHSVSRYQSESCQHQASLSGTLASENHCMHEIDYTHTNGGCCEDLREIVELDILSPISHDSGLCDDLEEESRKRKGDINGCYGPRSSNAGSQKTKGSALKMVHRLTLRSRNRSLPGSCENSPDERGSPGTGFQDSRMVKESKHLLYGAEQVEGSTKAGCSALPEPKKKSKLKGAAGSFARFLQGKLIKNPHDTIGQCI